MGFSLGKLNPFANTGINKKASNAVQTVAVVAGNIALPGSSLLTSKIASKEAQGNLNSKLGMLTQLGSSVYGIGAGGLANYAKGYQALAGSPLGTGVKMIGSGLSSGLGTIAGLFGGGGAPEPAFDPSGQAAPGLTVGQAPSVFDQFPFPPFLGNTSAGTLAPQYGQAGYVPRDSAPAPSVPVWGWALGGVTVLGLLIVALKKN